MSEQVKPALSSGYLTIESGADKHQVVLSFQTMEAMHAAHVELHALRQLPDVPLVWANREQLLLCTRQPREHAPGTLLDGQPRNVAGSALRTDYCNTPLYPRPAALPASWKLIERHLVAEPVAEAGAGIVARFKGNPAFDDLALALAVWDAMLLASSEVTLGDLFPLLEEEQAVEIEEDANHRCPDRALQSALFACLAGGALPRRYGGVQIDGGRYAWVTFTTVGADDPAPEPVKWWNGCDSSVPAALRFLANNERPIGGESRFNAEHLYQLAGEIERMAKTRLYAAAPDFEQLVQANAALVTQRDHAFEVRDNLSRQLRSAEERIRELLLPLEDGEPVLGWVDPERDEFLSVKGRQRAESMGHGEGAGRFSVPVVPAAESERLRALLAEALSAVEGGCHVADLPDRMRAAVGDLAVDLVADDALAAPPAPVVQGEALAAAGFAELDRRGFRVGASDLGIDDLVAVYRAMQAAEVTSPAKVSPDALRQAMENLAVRAPSQVYMSAPACKGPMVILGGVCLRVHYSGLKWYHDQLVNDCWEPLSVDEFDALLAEALAKA
ncbi:hypothetical protein [Pseudomonas sp. KCJK9000]|uniref:hypothetical protein n=1 Tax=Pseudomonas sp. KCJK9000 TaxID=3344566 RepID=UPI0039059F69